MKCLNSVFVQKDCSEKVKLTFTFRVKEDKVFHGVLH